MHNYPNFLVCVRSLTYNHKDFITDALNGFIIQETEFPYVVCVLDDASTDGTQDVIKSYVAEQFDIHDSSVAYERETEYAYITYAQHKTNRNCYIVVHYLKYNHYQIGKKKVPYLAEWRNYVKYEALCEGDDYWTDPLKLQKQVDFMNCNECCSLCFHHVEVRYDGVPYGGDCFADVKPGECVLEYMLRNWVIPTCSVLYRREVHEYIPTNSKFQYGDNVLFLTCFSHGLVYCVDGVMGVYRRNRRGWTMNKSAIEMMSSQYLHFNGLIESFPRLDLSILVSRVINTATYLLVNERRNISFQVRQQILDNFKSYPIRFLFHLSKKVLRAILNRLQK